MKPRTAACISISITLLIVILTVAFGIFPYFVIGFITLFLAFMLCVDAIRERFRVSSRSKPDSPHNWDAVAHHEIPMATREASEQAKQHLADSCEMHGKHVPRTGAYGLIEHPLRMDE